MILTPETYRKFKCQGFSHCGKHVSRSGEFCSLDCRILTEAIESTNITPSREITFSWLHPRAGGASV